jgi:hypothetical protein
MGELWQMVGERRVVMECHVSAQAVGLAKSLNMESNLHITRT